MPYVKLSSIALALVLLATPLMMGQGCSPFGCPTTGYEDGYAAGQKYMEIMGMYGSGSFESAEPPRMGSLMLEVQSYYRAPADLDCGDYDLQFAAGLMDGYMEVLWEMGQL